MWWPQLTGKLPSGISLMSVQLFVKSASQDNFSCLRVLHCTVAPNIHSKNSFRIMLHSFYLICIVDLHFRTWIRSNLVSINVTDIQFKKGEFPPAPGQSCQYKTWVGLELNLKSWVWDSTLESRPEIQLNSSSFMISQVVITQPQDSPWERSGPQFHKFTSFR